MYRDSITSPVSVVLPQTVGARRNTQGWCLNGKKRQSLRSTSRIVGTKDRSNQTSPRNLNLDTRSYTYATLASLSFSVTPSSHHAPPHVRQLFPHNIPRLVSLLYQVLDEDLARGTRPVIEDEATRVRTTNLRRCVSANAIVSECRVQCCSFRDDG